MVLFVANLKRKNSLPGFLKGGFYSHHGGSNVRILQRELSDEMSYMICQTKLDTLSYFGKCLESAKGPPVHLRLRNSKYLRAILEFLSK